MAQDVDCSGASRAVWLVKVPKYLSNAWDKADSSGIVGTLRISRDSQKQNVTFKLNEALASAGPSSAEARPAAPTDRKAHVPLEHRLLLSKVDQSLCVYSEESITADEQAGSSTSERRTGSVAFEGVVAQRADFRPVQDPSYMLLKKNSIITATNSVRKIKHIDRVTGLYKPVDDHPEDKKEKQRKKEEGKRARAEKDDVLEILFRCFEEHQYWNLKDLIRKTDQPVAYLKQILKDICDYNTKNPHKNMWELKPHYRHYKKAEDGGSTSK